MLEKLKQKIVEAVPEIMDKQNGCKIQYDLDGKTWNGEMYTNAFFWHLRVDNVYDVYDREIRDSIKFLGRPITLEDVFYALVKNKGEIPFKIRPYFPSSIQLEKDGRLLATWQLGKPLSEQSKKTIEFLYKLLVK